LYFSVFNTQIDRLVIAKWQEIDPNYKRIFFIFFMLNIFSYGFEMTNLILNYDDVVHFFETEHPARGVAVGRWLWGVVHYFFLNQYFLPLVSLPISISCMFFYGYFICRIWQLTDVVSIFFIIVILSLFPYMADIYTFNSCALPYALSHGLAAAGIYVALKDRWFHIILGAFLISLSIAGYQTVISSIAVIVVFFGIISLNIEIGPNNFKETLRNVLKIILAVLIGFILYFASVKISLYITGMHLAAHGGADSMFSLKSKSLFAGFSKAFSGTTDFLFSSEAYFPLYIKAIYTMFMSLSIIFLLKNIKNSRLKSLFSILLLTSAIFLARFLQIVNPDAHYPARTLTSYAVLYAGCFMICTKFDSIFLRNLVLIGASIMCLGFIYQNNQKFVTGLQNTRAEQAFISRIIARAEQLPGYSKLKHKVFASIGRLPRGALYNGYPFSGPPGINLFSATGRSTIIPALRLMRIDAIPPTIKQMRIAEEYARTHRAWPHPDSVAIVDDVVVIVLSNNHLKSKQN
jgi:hypothetical protein